MTPPPNTVALLTPPPLPLDNDQSLICWEKNVLTAADRDDGPSLALINDADEELFRSSHYSIYHSFVNQSTRIRIFINLRRLVHSIRNKYPNSYH